MSEDTSPLIVPGDAERRISRVSSMLVCTC